MNGWKRLRLGGPSQGRGESPAQSTARMWRVPVDKRAGLRMCAQASGVRARVRRMRCAPRRQRVQPRWQTLLRTPCAHGVGYLRWAGEGLSASGWLRRQPSPRDNGLRFGRASEAVLGTVGGALGEMRTGTLCATVMFARSRQADFGCCLEADPSSAARRGEEPRAQKETPPLAALCDTGGGVRPARRRGRVSQREEVYPMAPSAFT